MKSCDWPDARVLVTGGGGFIGGHLVRALVERGADVSVLVCEHEPRSLLWQSGDADRVNLVEGRLEDFDAVIAAVHGRAVDTVFHLGAQTIVGVAHRDPLATFEANVRGTYHVLEACRTAADRVRRVVVASSDKAYGDGDVLPYTEATPLAGRFPYDVSKSCTDLLALSYAASFGLPVAVARCGNVFGPADLNWTRIVPGTIQSLLRGERPVIRSNGSLVRDYLYVEDAVAAYLALADWLDEGRDDPRDAAVADRAFNFSSGRPLTVLEITRRIRAAAGREDLEPLIEDSARGEISAQHLDASRAAEVLGWSTIRDLDAALGTTVAWYRALQETEAAVTPGARR